jgi:hypothetical protein
MAMSSFGKQRQALNRRPTRSRPGLEMLETRITPSTFRVNTLLDTVAVDLKSGKDASGHITLRSAIQAANARPNADTIVVPQGTITLTIAGPGEDNAATGDLDLRSNVTIKGQGAGDTIIDANNIDRIFHIISGNVTISGMTVEHGHAIAAGGGLLNGGGNVTLKNVHFDSNSVVGLDGADGIAGTFRGTAVGEAGSVGLSGTAAEGGAIMNAAGSLTVVNGFIANNTVQGGNGGRGGNGAVGAGAAGNPGSSGQAGIGGAGGAGGSGADAFGGGIFNAAGARLTLDALFFSNTASGGNGGAGGNGGIGVGGAGGTDNGGVGNGGLGTGAVGGAGGVGGRGAGGGLFNHPHRCARGL